MKLAARTEGMITDPVYEGKSMAALIDLVSRGEIARDSTVLYAHLGGQPAINGYSALFSKRVTQNPLSSQAGRLGKRMQDQGPADRRPRFWLPSSLAAPGWRGLPAASSRRAPGKRP
jgi:hypothetical protein